VRHNGFFIFPVFWASPGGRPGQRRHDRRAKQVFENLTEILKAGGSGIDKLLRVTVYVHDMESWARSTKCTPLF